MACLNIGNIFRAGTHVVLLPSTVWHDTMLTTFRVIPRSASPKSKYKFSWRSAIYRVDQHSNNSNVGRDVTKQIYQNCISDNDPNGKFASRP
ncbi:hypothetical protein FCM35_KLT21749 [Carex littledalei]|uniref:Uncharacterized protein n=1 Tax=Carex littledalei TaxID=544730 RepID=A0A833Q8S4_9POAL|nr:hypothetical protein FCM35_KLT21749 [Carex littledalei]